jgi:SOS-response transcriptional repressor LexA
MSAPAHIQTRTGEYLLLEADLPGRGPVTLGVILRDPDADALWIRLRRDLGTLAEDEDLEVLEALAGDLDAKAKEMGAGGVLTYIEDTLSGTLRATDRETVTVDSFPRALDRLYHNYVRSNILPFRTHLPLYSLRAAAGKFLENEEVVEEGWFETPGDFRLDDEMFAARVVGHSMEPLIPDGSLCVFRYGVVGSRAGRLVLAEDLQSTGNNRYAVKRYRSDKPQTGEDTWRHTSITLESLNVEYKSWDLDPDEEKYRIIAEFIRVLD